MKIQKATKAHAQSIVLRPSDIRELSLVDPTRDCNAAVWESIEASKGWAYAALEGEEVVAVFGMADLGPFCAPWMLCSAGVRKHSRTVLKLAPAWLALMQRESNGKPLRNHIAKVNASTRAFVRHLGFVIEDGPHEHFDPFYLP